jgi:hypothetical protein
VISFLSPGVLIGTGITEEYFWDTGGGDCPILAKLTTGNSGCRILMITCRDKMIIGTVDLKKGF